MFKDKKRFLSAERTYVGQKWWPANDEVRKYFKAKVR